MRYTNRISRKLITAVLGAVSLLWAVQAWADGAVLDLLLGLLFGAYGVFAFIRLHRKNPIQATDKPISASAATFKRIMRNTIDSDIVLYLFVVYIIVRSVLPRLLNGVLPSFFEVVILVVFLKGLFSSLKQAFGLDRYRKSESRRVWDMDEATGAHGPETASGIVCPHCGTPVQGKEVDCKNCGKSMYARTAINLYTCPRCKQPIQKDDRVCANCGNVFIESEKEETIHVD